MTYESGFEKWTFFKLNYFEGLHPNYRYPPNMRNPVSTNMEKVASPDGRSCYSASLRAEIYTHIIKVASDLRFDLEIALCLEEDNLWKSSGLENNRSHCNCVL